MTFDEVSLELGKLVGGHLALGKSLHGAALVNERLGFLVWAEHCCKVGVSWELLPILTKLGDHPRILCRLVFRQLPDNAGICFVDSV